MVTTNFDQVILSMSESLTWRHIDSQTFNTRGDPTNTTSDSTVRAHVQIMDGSEVETAAGLLTSGDLIIFFRPSDVTTIAKEDEIQYNSKWYTVKNVILEGRPFGATQFVEVQAKLKMSD